MRLRDIIIGVFVGNLLTALLGYAVFAIAIYRTQSTVISADTTDASLRKNGENLQRQLRELEAASNAAGR